MSQFTAEDLKRILRKCAGEDEGAAPGEEFLGTAFEELGYDSLALMETASHIEREFGVSLRDEEMAEIVTPGELVDFVNSQAGQAA
jgi:act minimal PKS acyl carrier protein